MYLLVSCKKETSIENGGSVTVNATGTLKDSSGNCYPDSVAGTFYDGVTPGDTNYVQIKVNVATAGTYLITTDTVNGFYFKDSGFFTNTGLYIINLKAYGTPILQKATDFNVTFDSSVCSFTVNVQDSTGTGLGGGTTTNPNLADSAWQFSDGTATYYGPLDDSYTYHYDTTFSSQTFTLWQIEGPTFYGDSAVGFILAVPGSNTAPTAGSTYATTSTAEFGFFNSSSGAYIYEADNTTTSNTLTFTVDSYDSVNNILSGHFSGTAKTSSSGSVTISGGKFKAKVPLR
jgi:hypothetical protein